MNLNKYKHNNCLNSKSCRIESASSGQDCIFYIFKDLKKYSQDGDIKFFFDVLEELLDYVYEIDHLPQNFVNFFIDSQMLPIISNFVEEPYNDEMLFNIIEILDKLVTISVRNAYDFHQYLYENDFLELLFQIRDSVPSDLIPNYIHLVANFSIVDEDVRDKILNQYSPQLLESLIFEQGEFNIDIRRKTSFLVWRMTMFSLDDSVSDFLDWIIDYFAQYYLFLASDENSLMYWLFSLDNIILEQKSVKPSSLITYGYSQILYYFIKTRKHFFIQIDNEDENELKEVGSEDDEIVEISDKDKMKIDDLLEIVLKIIYFLVDSGPKNISELIIYDLLDISSEEWEKCSCLSIKLISLFIQKNNKSFSFNEFNEDYEPVNIICLLNLFDESGFSMKFDIILILREIVSSNDIGDTYKIGKYIIPFLLNNLEIIDNFILIRAMLDVLERILETGVRGNGRYPNAFIKVFGENGGFDFLDNYQDMILSTDINEDDANAISNMIDDIYSYFPLFDEEEENEEISYSD